MTKHFSLSVLAILASFSVSAATLDVHGEIKVNGKTVIDDKGNLIQDNSDLIDLNDYFNAKPNRVVTLEAPIAEDGSTQTYVFYYDETGREFKEETRHNGKISWSLEWKDRTPTSHTTIRYFSGLSNDGNTITPIEYTTTYSSQFTLSSSYPIAPIGVNMSRADIYKQTVTDSTDENEVIGKVSNFSDFYNLTVIGKSTFKFNENTLSDCIVIRFSDQWTTTPEMRTLCKGYGLVEFKDYKLTSTK